MLSQIENHVHDIARLCEKYGVRKLEHFDSGCQGEFDPETSDLDFIADFADRRIPGYLDRCLDFADSIEVLLGKDVDIVTANSTMSPHFRQENDNFRLVIYETKSRVAAA